jgi:hypothetical protein
MRPVALALGQRRAPRPDLIGPQRADRLGTERIQRRTQVLAQPHERRGRGLVLSEVGGRKLAQRYVRPMQRAKPDTTQRIVQCDPRLRLAPELPG